MSANQFGHYGEKGWTPEFMKSQKGKTFLITGATSGTGFEATRILLSKGAKVVMLNRNPQKSDDTIATIKSELGNNIDLSYIQVDLGEQASVKKAAAEVLINSYKYTYKKEIIVVRANNIYGIRQFPEKLISTSIVNLIKNKPIPIHGNGQNVRYYLSAIDFANATS